MNTEKQIVTEEMLIAAAQATLSPDQYDCFEDIIKYDADAYKRIASNITTQLKGSNE